jgi:hypothetical protein
MVACLVVVHDDDQVEVEFLPVLALVATSEADGVDYQALVFEPGGYSLVEVRHLEGVNVIVDLATCPWPASDDFERLEPLARRLEQKLRSKMAEPKPARRGAATR